LLANKLLLGLIMEVTRKDLRVLLLHEYRLGHKATEAARNICSTMGKDVVSTRMAHLWFKRFREGNYDLEDQPHPGRPVEVDINALKDLVEADQGWPRGVWQSSLGAFLLQ
jgi:transposase